MLQASLTNSLEFKCKAGEDIICLLMAQRWLSGPKPFQEVLLLVVTQVDISLLPNIKGQILTSALGRSN